MEQGVKYARTLLTTEPLSSIMKGEVIPGHEVQSEDDVRTFIKQNIKTVFHPIGTTSLGRVVDADLKVFGVRNLRLV